MQIKKILIAAIAVLTPLVSLMPQFTPTANAQSIVRGRCNYEVIGTQRGSRVNMRSAPGVESDIVGYVLVGQTVNQLRYDIGAAVIENDEEAAIWAYVEYVPSRTRGWIARSLLSDECIRN
ncbi:MAG: SH3 domain-containing protein [Pseudanabaena sp.]